MFTINEYIESLKNDKNTLVTNLTTKGITGLTGGETFTELAPKVLDITSVNNQSKSVTITSNTTTTIEADDGYTGLSSVSVTTAIPLPSGTINITTNGTHDVTDYASANVSVEADMSDYFGSIYEGSSSFGCGMRKTIKKIPDNLPLANNTTIGRAFYFMSELISLPIVDTSNTTDFIQMCAGCTKLQNVPIYITSRASNLSDMFSGCNSLTVTSLDNILQMCIGATSYTGTKTLAYLGLTNIYSASTIQALPHYQDFLNAGWTIGWS